MADPQKNKETVLAYYNMAFNDKKPAEARWARKRQQEESS